MKGIELQTIAFAFIAIVAVGLFLTFFTRALPDITTSVYCRLYQAANAIIYLTTKPPVPPECGLGIGTTRKDLTGVQSFVAERIAEYALDCWKRGQEGTGGQTFNCYEMNVEITDNAIIDETQVSDILIQKNQCTRLPNNLLDKTNAGYSCGNENKIRWEEDISSGYFIIKYDAFQRRIIVK